MPTLITSVPLTGPTEPAGRDAADAVTLAIADAGTPVEHVVLDAGAGWQAPNAPGNARRAVTDDDVIGYLGEFHSAGTRATLPVLEAGGVPQLSFSNTWRPLAGATFVNVMPHDGRQAAGMVAWMRELGVQRPFLLDDGDYYGAEMAWMVHAALAAAGVRVAGAGTIDDDGAPPDDLAGADAVFVGTIPGEGTDALFERLHELAPDAVLLSSDGILVDAFAAALPLAVAERVRVTASAARGEELPATARAVLARLGDAPDAHAAYAYEAAALLLDALAHAGADRAAIAERLRGTRERDSILGRYGIDEHGATTLATIGRRRIVDGRFVPA